jgi:cytochrome b
VESRTTRLVWDAPLRITHWLLALCVTGSVATHYAGVQWFPWHRRFGYAVLVLTVFRVVWGFVGTRHARFGNFLAGPGRVLEYLRGAPSGGTVGHNPLGALSVVAMLALLLVQATTGLFANDEIANAGPLFGWVTQEQSNRITGWHERNSVLLLVMIGLHLAAIAWYGLVKRQGLVGAMLTGRKSAAQVPAEEAIERSRTGLAVLIVVLVGAALALVVRAAPEATIALF